MTERVCIFRRIRVNDGTAKRPAFRYFEQWDGDEPNAFAWWTEHKRRAHRFSTVNNAREHLENLREHGTRERHACIVRVMGSR